MASYRRSPPLLLLLALLLAASIAQLALPPRTPVARAADLSSSYGWKTLKIGGGGFVTGLDLHPSTPGLVYARTDVGGAYRWDEASQTWRQIIRADSIPTPRFGEVDDYRVESLVTAPSDPNIAYMAVGSDVFRENIADGQGRILKSTNRGESWTDSGLRLWISGNSGFRQGGERLAVDPANASVVYFGSRRQGLWRSVDGAASWSQLPATSIPPGSNTGDPAGVSLVLFDRSAGTLGSGTALRTRRIYVGVAGVGIYRSDDAGATWALLKDIAQIPYHAALSQDGSQLYIGFTAASGSAPLLRYSAASNTWTTITPNNSEGVWEVALDPFNQQRLFAGPGGIRDGFFYRSLDGGATWTTLNIAVACPPDLTWICNTNEEDYLTAAALRFDPTTPNRLWFAQGMGVWRSSDLADSEVTWQFVSAGIEEMATWDGLVAPGGAPLTAVQDRQGFYHPNPDTYPTGSLIDGEFWGTSSLSYSGLQPNVVVAAQVKNNYYPSLTGRGGYSTDGGKSWTLFPSKPVDSIGGNIAVSASDPNNIVWLPSTGDINQGKLPYYSTNRGGSWAKSSGYSGTNAHQLFWWGFKRALDADKVQGGTFYLLTADGTGQFYVSRDGGATFVRQANAPACGLTDDCHVWGQMRAVPGKTGHVWSAGVRGGLWYTTDAGATPWIKLPGIVDARSFGFGKPYPGASYPTIYLYAKFSGDSHFALYRSLNQGGSWDKISDAPDGNFSEIKVVAGDPNIAGRVYIGFDGASFVYGDDTTLAPQVPAQPNLYRAVAGDGRVSLNWTALSGATGYTVRYGTSVTNLNQSLDVGSGISASVGGLQNGTTYFFALVASNAQGAGEPSAVLSARPTNQAPAAPTISTIVPGNKQLSLSWQGAGDAIGYKLKVGTRPGSYSQTIDVGEQTSHTLTGLINGRTYYLAVLGYNGVGDGALSVERTGVPVGPQGPRLTAAQANRPITVDGALGESDWQLSVPLTKTVVGSFNNSASAAVTWDDTYLYVGMQVQDSDLRNDSGATYQDDSVEIYIDGNDDRAEAYNLAFDRQFFLGWGDATISEQNGRSDGVLHAWSNIAGGYEVEIAIPWANFGVTPELGTRIGFDVGVNDDDGGSEREGQNVAYGIRDNYANLSELGELTLGAPAVLPSGAVKPVLECVATQNGQPVAWFGYQNENPVSVTIPAGQDNRFHPKPEGRGQPSRFRPGRVRFAFAVPFGNGALVWSLRGPDGRNRTATASKNGSACTTLPTATPTATPFPTATPTPTPAPLPTGGITVYDDALNSTWYSFQYNATLDFDQSATVQQGSRAIGFSIDGAWGLLGFGTGTPVPTSGLSGLAFWVHGGSGATRQLQVFTKTDGSDSAVESPHIAVDAPAGVWTRITVPLSALDNPGQIGIIIIQDRTGSAQGQLFVDEVVLTVAGTPAPSPSPIPTATTTATPTPTPVLGGNTRNGSWAVRVGDGSTYRNLYQTVGNITPNTNYTASFWFKGNADIHLRIMTGDFGSEIAANNGCVPSGVWQQCSIGFNSGANTSLLFRLTNPDSPALVFIDDAFLGSSGGANLLANPGFEGGETGWSSEPPFAILQHPSTRLSPLHQSIPHRSSAARWRTAFPRRAFRC